MTVTRANVEATKAFIRARLGNPYVYGGALSTNIRQGTDCSEVWQTVLEMVHGRWVPGRQAEGATTESYRYIPVGGVGPFGTIRVAHWNDIPANAAAKLAFHHGPGGGARSHMWGDLDGMLIESGGGKGLVTAPRALAIADPYGHAWAYLPGPVTGAAGDMPTLGVGSTGPHVSQLQHRLNRDGAGLEVDGQFGPLTAAAVSAFQRRTGVTGDPAGVVGQATWRALGISTSTPVPPPDLTRAERYALRIMAEGRRLNITPRGIKIAYAVGLVETNLTMYANRKDPASLAIPHDAVGQDHDSSGIYQQRPPWGSIQDRMDVEASTRIFFTIDRGPGVRGLTKIRDAAGRIYDYNDPARTPGFYAQKVQGSAFPERYDQRFAEAERLYDKLANLATADPWEELLAMKIQSRSPYATPGEPPVDAAVMIATSDMVSHRLLTEEDARDGDIDAIRRLARTAAGQGPNPTPARIRRAARILNEIDEANPEYILAATPGRA